MPIQPKKDESKDEFISRCVSNEMNSGKPQDQSLAICITKAEEHFSATSSVSDATWSTEAPINVNFSKVRRVLFNEDFDVEVARKYKEMGFKVYVRSSRKIKRKDNKVWNQLKQANLTEDNLVFGEIQQLDKRFQFDLLMTGEDPVLEMLSIRGREVNPKKVLKTFPVSSIQEAEMIEERERKLIDLKFATINFFYRYEEIPGIPAAQSGSRTFCKRLMSSNRRYTIEEIRSLSNTHLEEMFANYPGLEPDVFLYRGGFYRQPGTLNTTPYCRHQWTLEISMT